MTQSQSGASAEITRGWLPLLAATLGCGAGASSLVFYSLGVFVAPLEAAFGWTRGQITSAMLYSSAGLILAGPLLGWLIDRFGERRIALASIPGFALVLWSLSVMNGQLPLFYGCFFMAAVLGCGTTPILYTRAIAARFDRARGLALGITLAGPGTAALCLPPFLTAQIAAHGWRHGLSC
jgi:MFS family permease